jgi:hypothetical protein
MSRTSRLSFVVMPLLLLAVLARPAGAQTPPRVRPPSPPAASVRAYLVFDSTFMAASETFKAITDSSSITAVGAGGDVRVWNGAFLRVAGSHASRSGQRAIVFDGQSAKTGVPLKLTITPLEIGGGWQIVRGVRRPLTIAIGGGLLRMHYAETSDLAAAGDNISRTFTGSQLFGGVSIPLFGPVIAGGEVQYRSLPNAIGAGGVSKGFGETNLGGVTLRVLVGISR